MTDTDTKPETNGAPTAHPYEGLTPDTVLDAVDSDVQLVGGHADGRQLALNSYENRVYRVGTEEHGPIAAKFYRPGRWSDDAILEEHAFTLMLEETDRHIAFLGPLRLRETLGCVRSTRQAVLNLTAQTASRTSFSDVDFDESSFVDDLAAYGSRHFAHYHHINRMIVMTHWCEIDAVELVGVAERPGG